mmetsp:Transcript_24435/g.50051  ORF Transcript_24435/g.50051 Transcript_24435/m.50051 type:complete len:220 (-) Transcript_24435:826-1485(-)
MVHHQALGLQARHLACAVLTLEAQSSVQALLLHHLLFGVLKAPLNPRTLFCGAVAYSTFKGHCRRRRRCCCRQREHRRNPRRCRLAVVSSRRRPVRSELPQLPLHLPPLLCKNGGHFALRRHRCGEVARVLLFHNLKLHVFADQRALQPAHLRRRERCWVRSDESQRRRRRQQRGRGRRRGVVEEKRGRPSRGGPGRVRGALGGRQGLLGKPLHEKSPT